MKKMSKLFAAAMVLVLALSMPLTAFAAPSISGEDITVDQITVAANATTAPNTTTEGVTTGAPTVSVDEVKKHVLDCIKHDNPGEIVTSAIVLKVFDASGTVPADKRVTFEVAIPNGYRPLVMHQVNGEWVSEKVVSFTDTTVVAEFNSFSPVAIIAYKTASSGASVPSAPQTGVEFPMVAVVALAALFGAAYCVKKAVSAK